MRLVHLYVINLVQLVFTHCQLLLFDMDDLLSLVDLIDVVRMFEYVCLGELVLFS